MILDPLINAFTGPRILKNPQQQVIPSSDEEKKQLMFNKVGNEEVFMRWSAEGKISRTTFDTKFVRMLAIIGIVVGILLALMQDFVLIIVIGSVIFFYYTLHNKYQPGQVVYEISNYGFRCGEQMYYWFELKHFFFSQKGGQELLIVDTAESFLGRLVVIFNPEDKEKILKYMKDRILYLEKEPKNSIDKLMDSFSGKLNTQSQ